MCSLTFLVGCPRQTGPRYVPKRDRATGLPETARELVEFADRLLEHKPLTVPRIDRARAALTKAHEKGHPQPFEVYWRLARVTFLMADRLKNEEQIAALAAEGVQYANKARDLQPHRVEPYYYLALNLAKIAEAKRKLSLIKPMVKAAERARQIDATYDRAGPLVFLGKVYLTAPAWPVSVGNIEKAVELLELAVKIAPVARTRLFLAQAYLEDDQLDKARKQLELAKKSGLEPRWRDELKKTLERLNR